VLLGTCGVAVAVFRKWRGFAALEPWRSPERVCTESPSRFSPGIAHPARRLHDAGSYWVAPLLVSTADFVHVERSVTHSFWGYARGLALRGKDGATREKTDLSWRLELLQQTPDRVGILV